MNKDSLFISNTTYIPTWVFKGNADGEKEYIILPSVDTLDNEAPAFLSKADLKLMKESYNDTERMLTKHTKKFQPLKLSHLAVGDTTAGH